MPAETEDYVHRDVPASSRQRHSEEAGFEAEGPGPHDFWANTTIQLKFLCNFLVFEEGFPAINHEGTSAQTFSFAGRLFEKLQTDLTPGTFRASVV